MPFGALLYRCKLQLPYIFSDHHVPKHFKSFAASKKIVEARTCKVLSLAHPDPLDHEMSLHRGCPSVRHPSLKTMIFPRMREALVLSLVSFKVCFKKLLVSQISSNIKPAGVKLYSGSGLLNFCITKIPVRFKFRSQIISHGCRQQLCRLADRKLFPHE